VIALRAQPRDGLARTCLPLECIGA